MGGGGQRDERVADIEQLLHCCRRRWHSLEWQFEAGDEDALVKLPGSVSERTASEVEARVEVWHVRTNADQRRSMGVTD